MTINTLPVKYQWLSNYVKDGHPLMVVKALELYGIHEGVGALDNPVILGWAKEIGGEVEKAYTHDSIPWCGLFMALVAKRAMKEIPVGPLYALDWLKFGIPNTLPKFGDVLCFQRPGGGHVGLYVAEDATAYHVLGGNEGDQVGIVREAKTRLKGARRPKYTIQPSQVKVIQIASAGALSTNEA